MVFENEVPKELIKGKVYSSAEIENFLGFNNVIVISTDTPHFNQGRETKYEVVNVFEAYIHSHDKGYHIPSRKKKVITVEKI